MEQSDQPFEATPSLFTCLSGLDTLEGTHSPTKDQDTAMVHTEPTQSSVRYPHEADAMEKETTSEIFWQTLIPFFVGGFGSVICGLLVNQAQKTQLVCEVPHLIAIFVPLQGMKGNLDMTFTSRLGTMAHQGRLQGSGYMQRIFRNIALLEAQGIFISLFAVLMTFVLESLWHEGEKHPPVNDFLFLGANSLFSMCIANALSSVGWCFIGNFEVTAIRHFSKIERFR
ncbi:hypothetical protein TELCIR_17968 [Teladorsagia circumcincta]|uniref:SLC41A/MgtE integral membrane domain-containing protein n=1 Tax=Teladorsagia circumcincta TaxID=45464 RepID=A0A2G9TR90_TELCI|nr:hypothetical protein TELCIR_17968 [Teladorsagia circumcincta]